MCGITGAGEQAERCLVRYVECNGGDEYYLWEWRLRSMVCEDTHGSKQGPFFFFTFFAGGIQSSIISLSKALIYTASVNPERLAAWHTWHTTGLFIEVTRMQIMCNHNHNQRSDLIYVHNTLRSHLQTKEEILILRKLSTFTTVSKLRRCARVFMNNMVGNVKV